MNYYVVNYLVLDEKEILENKNIYLPMQSLANIQEFKTTIAKGIHARLNPNCIVIKSYKQVSMEEYNHLHNHSNGSAAYM
ncbi:MAG: hypothetical protein ABJB11_01450 [Ferruginibacter sp.]